MPARPWAPSPLWLGTLGLATSVACGCRSEPAPDRARSEAPIDRADSLALSRAGVEIWFTLARPERASDGKPCVERGLEIRRGGKKIPVPLLYTAETPTLLNDTTMRAILWTPCKPTDPYLVDLRTGRPTPDRGAGK
jgi:hypothetical protein